MESEVKHENRDHVRRPAKGRSEFDAEVTDVFDEMLRRSIPQYDVMRPSVFDIACPYAKYQTAIVDLGFSRGDALTPLVNRFGAHNRFRASRSANRCSKPRGSGSGNSR